VYNKNLNPEASKQVFLVVIKQIQVLDPKAIA